MSDEQYNGRLISGLQEMVGRSDGKEHHGGTETRRTPLKLVTTVTANSGAAISCFRSKLICELVECGWTFDEARAVAEHEARKLDEQTRQVTEARGWEYKN